jgi:hypothetical protein
MQHLSRQRWGLFLFFTIPSIYRPGVNRQLFTKILRTAFFLGVVSKVDLSRTLSKVEGCEVPHFQFASTGLSERENQILDF